MAEPLVEYEIDRDAPGDRGEIVESLAAVLISARERRRERAAAEREQAENVPAVLAGDKL